MAARSWRTCSPISLSRARTASGLGMSRGLRRRSGVGGTSDGSLIPPGRAGHDRGAGLQRDRGQGPRRPWVRRLALEPSGRARDRTANRVDIRHSDRPSSGAAHTVVLNADPAGGALPLHPGRCIGASADGVAKTVPILCSFVQRARLTGGERGGVNDGWLATGSSRQTDNCHRG